MKYKFFGLLVLILPSIAISNTFELWSRSGANANSTKWSDQYQINSNNINELKLSWIYKSGNLFDSINTVQTNPIYTGKHLVTTTVDGLLVALEPSSGIKKWSISLPTPVGRRGITYHEGNLFIPSSKGVYIVKDDDGGINTNLGKKGVLGEDASYLPPVVIGGIVYVANLTNVSAYELKNGNLIWKTGLEKNGVLARVWSGFSYDPEVNMLFVVTSDTGNLVKNLKTKPKSHYANSLLAINGENGRVAWSIQEIDDDTNDLDMVGPPIISKLSGRKIVIAFSKSGTIIIADAKSGKSLDKVVIGQNQFKIKIESEHLEKGDEQYIKHKLRNATNPDSKFATLESDHAQYGLHGGPEWPGGAINPERNILYLPVNRYPWILRVDRLNGSNFNVSELTSKNYVYMQKCVNCHGKDQSGFFLTEHEGDYYAPSLIGMDQKKSRSYLISLENFVNNHKYADKQYRKKLNKDENFTNDQSLFARIIRKSLIIIGNKQLSEYVINIYSSLKSEENNNTNLSNITKSDLASVYNLLEETSSQIKKNGNFNEHGFFQMLVTQSGDPASRPPWGLIYAVDINSGKIVWKTPFGSAILKNGKKVSGLKNFGGVIATKGGVLIANGTTDAKARIYDEKTGEEIWSHDLPAAGSAPPMTYKHNGCQYIIFTATGGRYIGFDKKSDSTLAYKLSSCIND